MSAFRKRLRHPLIQAQTGRLGGRDDIGMQVRRNSDIESSGEALVG